MKVISFFSKLAIICNISFLLFIFLGKLEAAKPAAAHKDLLAPVPFFKDIIITLGLSAIIINLIMCLVYSIVVILGKQRILPKWLAIVNFLFLILQFLYYFFR